MKYVRFLFLVLATSMFVAPVANAQGGGRGGGRGGMTALMQNITLTADQQTKVDSIVAKHRAMRPQMQGMDSAGMAAARSKMMENNNKQYDEIRAVLTPDQQKVFDENRKNMPMGRGRPPGALG